VGELCKAVLDGSLVQKALSEGTGSAGGYAVPIDFIPSVWAIATGASTMLPIVSRVAMTTNVVNLVSLTTDWTLVWLAEADSITEGDPIFGRPVLTAKKVASRFNLSNELLRDNQVDLLQAGWQALARQVRPRDRPRHLPGQHKLGAERACERDHGGHGRERRHHADGQHRVQQHASRPAAGPDRRGGPA
jgi:hypothetical protein